LKYNLIVRDGIATDYGCYMANLSLK